MNDCLLIPDIFNQVLSYFGVKDDVHYSNDCRSLCAIARTCKAFSSPALDLLWTSQKSLVPLLGCLSYDACPTEYHHPAYARQNLDVPSLNLCRDLIDADWTRCLIYGSRIWRLQYDHDNHNELRLSDRTCTILRKYLTRSDTIILPNLKYMGIWEMNSARWTHLLAQFLAPSIESVQVCLPRAASGAAIDVFLNSLTLRCPKLCHIALDIPFRGNLDKIAEFITQFAMLETASTTLHYDFNSVHQTLATYPILTGLELSYPSSTVHTRLRDWPSPTDAFMHLELSVNDRAHCHNIRLQRQRLQSLRFVFLDVIVLEDWFERSFAGFDLILQQCDTEQLTALKFYCNEHYTYLKHVALGNLKFLAHFSSLTTFVIDFPNGLDVDDTAVIELAAVCPFLEHLVIGRPRNAIMHRVTRRGVCGILNRCFHLVDLVLGFDSSEINIYPTQHQLKHSLQRWCILESLIADPVEVSQFIKELAPSLNTVQYLWGSGELGDLNTSLWNKVIELLSL